MVNLKIDYIYITNSTALHPNKEFIITYMNKSNDVLCWRWLDYNNDDSIKETDIKSMLKDFKDLHYYVSPRQLKMDKFYEQLAKVLKEDADE